MTTIDDGLSEAFAVGERFRLSLVEIDGELVSPHPNEACPMDVVVNEGVERLDERPPGAPVDVEILPRFVGNRIAGRIVEGADEGPNV